MLVFLFPFFFVPEQEPPAGGSCSQFVKKAYGFFDKKDCAAFWRLIVCRWQTISTRHSARSIFCRVHAAAKYDETGLPPPGGKVCDAFFDRLGTRAACGRLLFCLLERKRRGPLTPPHKGTSRTPSPTNYQNLFVFSVGADDSVRPQSSSALI